MKYTKRFRLPRASGMALAMLMLPLLAGCTIVDAVGNRDKGPGGGGETKPEVVVPETDPQDQRVTLYVLGVDGVD
jgi:hypothetical protein